MKVRELADVDIVVGIRIRGESLRPTDGTVTEVSRDNQEAGTYILVQWDDPNYAYSGFYANVCENEVLSVPAKP
jgi:hypothetical protein